MYALCDADRATYPIPSFGTATRRLKVEDNFGNVVLDSTVNAASNVDVSWSPGGGNRTYYVRGWSYFSWPTSATLTFGGLYVNSSNRYVFQFELDTAVDGDFTVTANNGVQADMYFNAGCTDGSEVTFGNTPSTTVTRGQYGYGDVLTNEYHVYGFSSYRLINVVYIDGDYYAHGSTFVRGATTVTVNITTSCQPL